MRTIYKYPITLGENVIEIPSDHRVLHVAQDPTKESCIWVELDPQSDPQEFTFRVYGTGHTLNNNLPEQAPTPVYLGTWMNGPFVWHLYGERR